MSEDTAILVPIEPRYPRLLSLMRWFQRHRRRPLAAAAALMAAVLSFDLPPRPSWIAGGFYLIPLAFIALTLRRTHDRRRRDRGGRAQHPA